MFGLGALVIFAIFHESFFWPNSQEFYYLGLCAATGVAGQFLLTNAMLAVRRSLKE